MSSDKPLATPPSAEERAARAVYCNCEGPRVLADKSHFATCHTEVRFDVEQEIRSAEQARDEVWRGKLAELEAKLRRECRFHDGCSAADELAALRKESGE